jgi:hypothetical protein
VHSLHKNTVINNFILGRRVPLLIGTGILSVVLFSTGLSSAVNDNPSYNDTF